jgi:2-isopropylmalate synthase
MIKVINQPVEVVDYHEHSIGSGSGVSAVCYIELKVAACSASFGVAKDSNIMTAAFTALVCGVNRRLGGLSVHL